MSVLQEGEERDRKEREARLTVFGRGEGVGAVGSYRVSSGLGEGGRMPTL